MAEKMLIVDDDELVLTSCRKIFEAEGFTVTTTKSSQEGLGLAATQAFDVILVDWKLPDSNGMDLIEGIGKSSPNSAVVMISGYATVNCACEALKRGAMDYLAKPFKPEEIIEAVKKAVKRKIVEEKNAVSRFEKIIQSLSVPAAAAPSIDDKAPKGIAETFAQTVSVAKATSPWFAVAVLGILAGAYIGFGGMLSATVTFDAAAKVGLGLSKLVGGAVFSVGLMMVVIAGAELFTGNNLMVSGVMSGKITCSTMLKRWIVVFLANFVGALLITLIFYYSGLWKTGDYALGATVVKTASTKVGLPFGEAIWRGIGCNWLVCVAVWMATAARQTVGKVFAILFPIMAFVAMGFEHCIANMYFIPTGILFSGIPEVATVAGINTASLTWGNFLANNLLPVTIGNILGGVIFVGMGYWGAYMRPAKK
jgi:formate/nitrite transporter